MKNKQAILGGKDKVKVAIAQISSKFLDREASIDRAIDAIKEAGENNAELVVFPEVWLSGYPYWTEGWDSNLPNWIKGRVRFHDSALIIPSDDTDRLVQAARDADTHLVMGCNEMDSRPGAQTIYNTLLFISREGKILGRHRKLIPTFTERMFWGRGDGHDLTVFETDIGRIGGLICGEHLMTTVRAAMAAQGEHIHIAVFPGSFALHTGPRLEEPDKEGAFWGHFAVRSHAMEAGTFVVQACAFLDESDIPEDFPYKNKMNTSYAHGGSSIIGPLGVPVVEPRFGAQIIYGELQADMIKAGKAILDSVGHYSRPDVLRLLVRRKDKWESADKIFIPETIEIDHDNLLRAGDNYDVDVTNIIENEK